MVSVYDLPQLRVNGMPGKLTADMKRIVGEHRLGFVATVCPDGTQTLRQGHDGRMGRQPPRLRKHSVARHPRKPTKERQRPSGRARLPPTGP